MRRPPRRNTDETLRDLERRAAQGDYDAMLALLRARARAGQLQTFPEVNTIVAFSLPRGSHLNESAHGTNESEFVDMVLRAVYVMTKKGGSPDLISTEYGDVHFPSDFGRDQIADLAWIREAFLTTTRRSSAYQTKRRMEALYREAFQFLRGAGFTNDSAHAGLRRLEDAPEIMQRAGFTNDFTALDYAIEAGREYANMHLAGVEGLEARRQRGHR